MFSGRQRTALVRPATAGTGDAQGADQLVAFVEGDATAEQQQFGQGDEIGRIRVLPGALGQRLRRGAGGQGGKGLAPRRLGVVRSDAGIALQEDQLTAAVEHRERGAAGRGLRQSLRGREVEIGVLRQRRLRLTEGGSAQQREGERGKKARHDSRSRR